MSMRYAMHRVLLAGLASTMAFGCDGDSIPSGPQLGAIDASVVTTGAEPDPNGYRLIVDGALDIPLPPSGSHVIGRLAVGGHTITLEDVAGNCQVAGANPRIVTVRAARETAVDFSVTCVQFTGSIRVTATTTGADPDANGYSVAVDQDPSYPVGGQAIARDGSATFTHVPGGHHTVSLGGVARNCTVVGANPRPAPVMPGLETLVAFNVECQALGALRLISATSGTDPDLNGYSVALALTQFDTSVALLPADTVTVTLPASDVTVTLGDLATNCNIAGPHGRQTVVRTDTTTVRFDVTCTIAPHLALVSYQDGNPEIYVIKANGGDPRRLTFNTADDGEPAWSPDGSRIAFRSNRDGNDEIYVMNADGSNPVRLTNSPEGDISPTWSPDGARIAFASFRDGNGNIFVMNADGTNVVRLTMDGETDLDPAWSPTGGRIAFVRYRDGSHDILVINVDGSGLASLTVGADDDRSPAWSPDGSQVAFSRAIGCYYYCEYDLHVMRADGSGVTRLPIAACDEVDPAWSPDGSRIAFTSVRSYYGLGCPTSVMVMRADGSHLGLVTNGGAHTPTWRP